MKQKTIHPMEWLKEISKCINIASGLAELAKERTRRIDALVPTGSLLKQQILIANGGKIKIKKPKKWLYPMTAERIYIKQVQAINKIFWEKVNENIIPNIPLLIAEAKSIRGDEIEKEISKLADSFEPNGFFHRGDFYLGEGTFNRDENERKAVSKLMERADAAWVDQLKLLMDKTYLDFSKAVGKPQLDVITMEQAQRISVMNKTQFVKVIHSALSVNPITNETWLEPQIKAFQSQNTDLITALSLDQKQRVEQTLYRNLSSGKGIESIKAELDKDEAIGQNRSRLIARDQTNKFNGQLSQLRQKEVGIGSYIWTTSRDERVRPAHRALDGEIFSWSKPSAEGHPGEPIQCRCIAQPVITDEMFDE
jgi:SPP1 gp7 family putative phage head morphogenesis protein